MTHPVAHMACVTLSALAALGLALAAPDKLVADLNDGLVGYWSFDEGQEGTAYDYSGNGNHGAIEGASWTCGVCGSALYFDGVDDYVSIADSPAFDVGDEITVGAWINTTVVNAGSAIAVHDLSQAKWLLYASGSTHTVSLFYVRTSSGWELAGDSSSVSDGVWHYVVGTFRRSSPLARIRMYIDGVLTGTNDGFDESILAGDQGVHIGSRWGGLSDGFNGIIDEVRVYDRALSPDEILDLYWSTTHPDPQDDTTDGDKSDVSGTSADPVNTATGSFFHQETDLSIPSRGSPLIFTRFYNSKAAAPGRKAGKSGKAVATGRDTPTSQPASTKDGKRSSVEAKKPGKSLPGKDQKQAAPSSKGQAKAKEDRKCRIAARP